MQTLWTELSAPQQETVAGGIKDTTVTTKETTIGTGFIGNEGGTLEVLSNLLEFISALLLDIELFGLF